MLSKNLIVFLLSLATHSFAVASEMTNLPLKQKIEQAIAEFEQTPKHHWSFQVSRYENEEDTVTSSVEHFDPRKDQREQWLLLKHNGETPTEEQQRAFATKKFEKGDKHSSVVIKLVDLIQTDSLEMTSEDSTHITARFAVFVERLGERTSRRLQGELVYSKSQTFIQHIRITNKTAFTPVLTAKITDFILNIDFLKIDSAVFVEEVSLSMKGRFAWLVEIDEVSKDTYSDFQYWGNASKGRE